MNKLRACTQLARPHQYLKNGFIWLPLFFGHKLHDFQAVLDVFGAFLAFCFAASSVYILNDLKDIEEDRQHPVKKLRPLACGALEKSEAVLFLVFLFFLSVLISVLFLPQSYLFLLGIYLLLNLTYSWGLKHLAIIDVTCIATGFVLRIFAGGLTAQVWPSHWLILMTFLLALFLALSKRRDDLILAAQGHNYRRSLDGYNLEFVSLSMVLMASVIIVSYILYTVSPEVVTKHKTNYLYLTTFWVIIGLLRYMQITFVEQRSGSPTLVLLKDIFLQTVLLLWIGSFYFILYVLGY
jgi:4-hydroxybenzoate polyprenyltransferase